MRRTVTALVIVVAAMCCGQGCPSPVPKVDPLVVNDTLRAACNPWGAADPDIRGLLLAVDADLKAGNPRTQEVSVLTATCVGPFPDNNQHCLNCTLAIIDQIYGH